MAKPKAPIDSYELVVAEWEDAHADLAGWGTEEDVDDEPYIVRTVGVLLPPVKSRHLSIAQSIGSGHIDSVLHIPRKMVRSVTVLGTMPKDYHPSA